MYCEQCEGEDLEKTSSRRPTSRTSSVSDDDPRWRSPEASHGFETGFENGSAAEELRRRCAWLHHGQVTTDLPNTRLWRDDRARWQAPPLIIVPTTTSVAAVLGPVKARPGNDGACGQGRATADLDRPCARRPQHVWVGAKKRDSKSNKETGMKERSGEWCKIYA